LSHVAIVLIFKGISCPLFFVEMPTQLQSRQIPDMAIPRLSHYYRALLESRETQVISSDELSRLTGYTAAQIRRDLACFGQFGTPGRGYSVLELKNALLAILGIDKEWRVALVGVGNLGQALLGYQGFREQGFKVLLAFDSDPQKIGLQIRGVPVYLISELNQRSIEHNIQMAILTVPASVAQHVVDELVKSGVAAILNFVPMSLKVPEQVTVQNIDMAIELERLSYRTIRNRNGFKQKATTLNHEHQ